MENENKKRNWFKEIRLFEHPEPVEYFYIIDHCTFSFSDEYIKNTPLEKLKAEYEDNKLRVKASQRL